MDTYVVTYIYPKATSYIPDFVKSLNEQTKTSFSLLIFNDGLKDADDFFTNYRGNYQIVEEKGTPLEVRVSSLQYLSSYSNAFFIFCDIDDTFSDNRIESVTHHLNNYDLVCNDLTIMNNSGLISHENVWRSRLGNNFEFDYTFIEDLNIIGFGNTGVRSELLKTNVLKPTVNVAADWFIFYQLIYYTQVKCLFTSECTTHYRQHDDNLAGLSSDITIDKVKRAIEMKTLHYKALTQIGIDKTELLNELQKIDIYKEILTPSSNTLFPFWWEETTMI